MCKYNEGTGLGFGHEFWCLMTFVVPTWLIMFGFACLTIASCCVPYFGYFEANSIVLYYEANIVMCITLVHDGFWSSIGWFVYLTCCFCPPYQIKIINTVLLQVLSYISIHPKNFKSVSDLSLNNYQFKTDYFIQTDLKCI